MKKMMFDEVPRVSGRPYVEIIDAKVDKIGNVKMTVDSGATTTNIYSNFKFENSNPISIRILKNTCLTSAARVRPTSDPGHENHLLGMDCLVGKILVLPPPNFKKIYIGWPKK